MEGLVESRSLSFLLPPDVVELFPMSDIQQGMVFDYMRHEGVGIYHDQFVYKVSVPGLDKKKLSKAMEILAERHPMLRTGFFSDRFSGSGPVRKGADRSQGGGSHIVIR